MHLDEGGDRRPAAPAAPTRVVRQIDVTLRSTPPGAEVAVDGVVVGTTPTYWPGDADGREHEFTFALAGHAIARYRFVPVTSGVLHARLEPVVEEPKPGDSEAEPEPPAPSAARPAPAPAPAPAPSPAPPAPLPPPTVLSPPDGGEPTGTAVPF